MTRSTAEGSTEVVHLQMDHASLVIALAPTGPEIAYLGPALPEVPDADLRHLNDWPAPHGDFDGLLPVPILPEASRGFQLNPGISGHRADGRGAAPQMGPPTARRDGDVVAIIAEDPTTALAYELEVRADPTTSLVTIAATVTNTGDTGYQLDGVMLTIPVPRQAGEVMTIGGRWSYEFQPERHPWPSGTVVVENRSGRTSFDRRPFIAVGSPSFAEESGEVWAAHLAWSGNASMRAEVLRDGRRILQGGELLLPGEVTLEPGASYTTPELHLATSASGLNGISAAFHRHIRQRPQHPKRPRPVGLNTWEAVYFEHDLETLTALADRAAAVGVERFILDDGWFHGRRDDTAGLGDWWVDESIWPDGLGPLVDHVTGLGMEFGLWFEPEMVNPDSDLYRAHPEWVLANPSHDHAMFRHQLVLDLANPDVADYLFDHVHRVLDTHDIAYVKWDSNRDLSAPEHGGRATVRAQIRALYDLLARVKAAHPNLEIESCASGGARVDLGVLQHTDRFWASDCNDALDRQQIQRGISYLIPPELVGAHIGPPRSHTTGRRHSLAFRAATALFGHLGIEWNILDATDRDLDQLTEAIALHKRLRPLLHSGEVRRFDHPDPAICAHGVISADKGSGIVSVAQVATSRTLPTGPLRVTGFDPDARLRLTPIDLGGEALGKAKVQPAWIRDGSVELSGRQLAMAGIVLPVLNPESALLVEVSPA